MRRALLALVVLLAAVQGAGAAVVPNDPAWPDQRAAQKLGLPDVWAETTGDPGIVIAVVDTGVAPVPDLEGAFAPGYDFIEGDQEAQDVSLHGTRVAAVIAARGNDRRGMAGHCWRCRIMPVRISSNGSTTPAAIATAIVYAANAGARIINVSLAHAGYDAAEADAVKYAIERGAIVVASAGNTGTDTPQYPAALPGVVSVGATDDADELYFWSSRGPWVMLTAPGCHMVVDAVFPPGTLCGTSFTPGAVSGVLGLIWSKDPGLTRDQILGALLATARKVPNIAHGRVDPMAALRYLNLAGQSASPVAPAATPSSSTATQPKTAAPRKAAAPRYTRQTVLETGSFRRGFRTTFVIGRGRVELHLQTPRVSGCTLTLASGGELIIAPSAVRNLLSLSETVPAGRYTATVRCSGSGTRGYSLGLIGMFPRLP